MIQSLTASARTPYRFGLIGLGNIGKIHLRHLLDSPDATVVAIAEVNEIPEEDRLAGVRYYQSYDALLEDADIDAVVNTLPHSLHADSTNKALRAGKHVFLEKPVATAYKEAQALVECADEHNRTLMVNMTHRFYPPLRKARELMESGVVGEIMSIRDYYMEVIDRAAFPSWFFDPHLAGGGVAITDAVHLIDRIEWLIGEPLTTLRAHGKRVSPDIDVEDCVEFLCTTPSGIPITVGSYFCFEGPRVFEDGLIIYGSKGILEIHAWSHVEWRPYGGGPQRFEGYPKACNHLERASVGHRAALMEFLAALREGRAPESEGRAVINAQKAVEVFYDFQPSAGFFRPLTCV